MSRFIRTPGAVAALLRVALTDAEDEAELRRLVAVAIRCLGKLARSKCYKNA